MITHVFPQRIITKLLQRLQIKHHGLAVGWRVDTIRPTVCQLRPASYEHTAYQNPWSSVPNGKIASPFSRIRSTPFTIPRPIVRKPV